LQIIFITDKFGDLGNRLFRFARFYCCKPQSIFLCDLSFYQYAYIYSPKNWLYFLTFKILSLLSKNSFSNIFNLIKKYCLEINLISGPENNNNNFSSDVFDGTKKFQSRFFFVNQFSYYYKSKNISLKSKQKLKSIFNIKHKYRNKARELLHFSEGRSVLVGVHMRRGDYREFNDGVFYYDDETYLKNISALKNTYRGSKRLKFLLISNELINLENYRSVDYLHFGMQDAPVDMSLLQSCDYILAPPSTFSGWCSFLHDIPIFIVRDRNILCSWSDFKLCDANSLVSG
jgi:hypothetical protein